LIPLFIESTLKGSPRWRYLDVKRIPTLRHGVHAGVAHDRFRRRGAVEDADGQRGHHGEQHVVHADRPALEHHLAGPGAVDGEPQLHNNNMYMLMKKPTQPNLDDVEEDVLVERVEDDPDGPVVAPRAVHKQQPRQEAELQRKIALVSVIDSPNLSNK